MLPWTVNDDALGLGEGAHQVLHVRRRAATGKNHDRPIASGGVVQHCLQLLLFFPVACSLLRWCFVMIGIDCRVWCVGTNLRAIRLAKEHASDHQAGHTAFLPRVEALFVALHPVLERAVVAEEYPGLHG